MSSAHHGIERRLPRRHVTSLAASAKRGELLVFRPRRRPGAAPGVQQPPAGASTNDDHVVIVHGGCEFVASATMAQSFLAHAQRVIDRHGSELVPLLHSHGVDLLFITYTTPLDVKRPTRE